MKTEVSKKRRLVSQFIEMYHIKDKVNAAMLAIRTIPIEIKKWIVNQCCKIRDGFPSNLLNLGTIYLFGEGIVLFYGFASGDSYFIDRIMSNHFNMAINSFMCVLGTLMFALYLIGKIQCFINWKYIPLTIEEVKELGINNTTDYIEYVKGLITTKKYFKSFLSCTDRFGTGIKKDNPYLIQIIGMCKELEPMCVYENFEDNDYLNVIFCCDMNKDMLFEFIHNKISEKDCKSYLYERSINNTKILTSYKTES